jgi:putative transposase
MDGSIQLSLRQRKALLSVFRTRMGGSVCRRAQIILLLANGYSYREVRAVTGASFKLIRDCIARFRHVGVSGFVNPTEAEPSQPKWVARVISWLTHKTPEDFGYFRSRWSCHCLAEVLAWETGISLSAETIRRRLRQAGFVWRRPRPVVGPSDPDHDRKLRAIQTMLHDLQPDETAVFQDEVDVHLNPKIGSCWMPKGQQTEVVTPGNNVKRHLAGSLVWRTGTLLISSACERRDTDLFLEHLDDLRRRLRGYRVIHVICDNAPFHASGRVRDYLKRWGHRIRLHHLPKYAPETNPIERIWWRLHETLTRNHRYQDIDALLNSVYDWVDTQRYFFTATLAQYANAA